MTDTSILIQQHGLAHAYAAGDARAAAIHHLNLSRHMAAAGAEPTAWLAQQVAGTVLLFQADSDLLPDALGNLAMVMLHYAPRRLPASRTLTALSESLGEPAGTAFQQLSAELGSNGGADSDEALHAVLGLAQTMAGVS